MASAITQFRNMILADSVTKRRKDGVIVLRRGFFYRMGGTAESFADKVRKAITENGINATVIKCGEVWKPFRGGSTVANSSHWFVEVVENKS